MSELTPQPNQAPTQEQEPPLALYHQYLDEKIACAQEMQARFEDPDNRMTTVGTPEQVALKLARYDAAKKRLACGDFGLVGSMMAEEIANLHKSTAKMIRENEVWKTAIRNGEIEVDAHLVRQMDSTVADLLASHRQRIDYLSPLEHYAFNRYMELRDEYGRGLKDSQ